MRQSQLNGILAQDFIFHSHSHSLSHTLAHCFRRLRLSLNASKYNLNFNRAIWFECVRGKTKGQDERASRTIDMTFFIRPQGENVHTNLSGVRKCQRRHQNEIIFYHFPFSHPSIRHLTFRFFLLRLLHSSCEFSVIRGRFRQARQGETALCVCTRAGEQMKRASECVCLLTNVPSIIYLGKVLLPHKLKYIQLKNVSNNFLCNDYEFNGRLNER